MNFSLRRVTFRKTASTNLQFLVRRNRRNVTVIVIAEIINEIQVEPATREPLVRDISNRRNWSRREDVGAFSEKPVNS